MTYERGGLIESVDYNNIISSSTGFNGVWSTGNGKAGYGQTSIASVSSPNRVQASNWAELYDKYLKLLQHQTSASAKFDPPLTRPAAGSLISWAQQYGLPSVPGSAITSLYDGTGNASETGDTESETVTRTTNFTTSASFYFYVEFSTGDQARYFFNAGGLISFDWDAPNKSTVPGVMLDNLAKYCGDVYLSQTNSPSKQIEGQTYNGVTQINRNDYPNGVINSLGYFELTTSYTEIFRQTYGTGPYANSYIKLSAKTNGVQGSNGDNGNKIEFLSEIVISPSTSFSNANTRVRIQVIEPSNSRISKTWGNPTIYGSLA